MRKYVLLFRACYITAAVGALSLFLIMFSSAMSSSGAKTTYNRILGAVFWVSLIAEVILIFKVDLQRKIVSLIEGYDTENGRPGAFNFSRNIYGKTADIILIVSLLAMIIMRIGDVQTKFAVIPCSCLLYFSAVMHCIFNGKNFRFLCEHKNKGDRAHEEK